MSSLVVCDHLDAVPHFPELVWVMEKLLDLSPWTHFVFLIARLRLALADLSLCVTRFKVRVLCFQYSAYFSSHPGFAVGPVGDVLDDTDVLHALLYVS